MTSEAFEAWRSEHFRELAEAHSRLFHEEFMDFVHTVSEWEMRGKAGFELFEKFARVRDKGFERFARDEWEFECTKNAIRETLTNTGEDYL
jgi:hypothetical protein